MPANEEQVDVLASLLLARAELLAVRDLCVKIALQMNLDLDDQHPEKWINKKIEQNVDNLLRTTEDSDASLAAQLHERLAPPT